MGADVELYEDPAGLPYDGLVAAWHEVDSRSAWLKARLAAAVPREKLRQYAADVGAAHSTVASYRSVGKAYATISDVRNLPFAVAETLMGQEDHLELAGRGEPWTVREARELVAERARAALPPGKRGRGRPRKPEPVTAKPEPVTAKPEPVTAKPETGKNTATPASSPSSPVQESVQTGTGTAAEPVTTTTETATTAAAKSDPEPHVHRYEMTCRCGARVPERDVLAMVDRREAELEEQRGKIARQAKTIAELMDEVDRLSDGSGGRERVTPPTDPLTAGNTADSARGNGQGTPELDAEGNLTPGYEDFGDPWPGFGDEQPAPDYEGSQVPARGRRRR